MSESPIQIHCDIDPNLVFIPSDGDMILWAQAPLALLRPNGELNLGIVDAQTIQELNKTYRKKDKATNVLSFPSQVPTEVMPNFLGDILICATVVADEAKAQHKSLNAYWAHMIVHGILHLLGYDHTTEEQALPMETLERQLLASLGFADPYQELPYDL